MRRTILPLALVLLASPAQAETIRLWMGSAFDTEHSTFRDFTISTSPTAYISIAASEVGLKILRPSDGANVAALIADLTNGVANPVTWANGSFSYTVAENIGFGNVFSDPPVVGRSGDLNGIDFAGTSIERFELYRSNTGGIKGYGLSIYGHLPEPGLGAMLLTLCGCCAHFRMGPRSRSIGR